MVRGMWIAAVSVRHLQTLLCVCEQGGEMTALWIVQLTMCLVYQWILE